MFLRTVLFVSAFYSLTLTMPPRAAADAVEDFYRGKHVSIYVGAAPGGAYDSYARVVSRYLGQYVPGQPSVIVQNMPGAGAMRMTNYVYNVAPKDGTAIAEPQRGLLLAPLLQPTGVQYDSAKFNWLGSMNTETGVIMAWHTARVKTMQDLFETELIVGGTGPSNEYLPIALNNIMHTKFKIISGYPGAPAAVLAMEKGEVEGRVHGGWMGIEDKVGPWVKEGKVRLLALVSIKRSELFPGVPAVLEFARSDQERQVLELILAGQLWGRPFALPAGVPADRVAAMRKAFEQLSHDDKFRNDARRQGLEVEFVSGEEIGSILTRVAASPPEVIEIAKKAIAENGN